MARSEKSLSVLRVEEALLKEGYKDIVKELDQTARSAKDAAASLNVELGAIVKTLVSVSYTHLTLPTKRIV